MGQCITMVNKAVILLLILSPVIYKAGMADKAILFEGFIFEIGVVILFIASLFDKPIRELKNNWLIISFLGLCLFNIFCHSLTGSVQINNDIVSVIKPFTVKYLRNALLIMLSLTIMIKYISNVESFYKYIVYAVIMNLLVFDIQILGWYPISCNEGLPGGFMGNSARFTNYLAITLPFVFGFSFWLFLVSVIASLQIEPQVGTLLVALLLLFVHINSKLFRGILAASFLGGVFAFTGHINKSLGTRLPQWKTGIELFFLNPVSGLGLGAVGEVTKNMNSDSTLSNSLLQIILEGGIGFGFWIYNTLKAFFKKFDASTESMAILSLLMISLIEYPFEIKRLWFTIIFIISAFVIKQIDKEFSNGSRT